MRRFAVLLAFSVVLPACGSHGASPTPTGTDATVSRSSAPASSALGVHWPGADLPAGAVLYDNGRRLTAYSLNGTSTVVWVHRRVQVSAIAASLNGHELAYIVGGSRQQLVDLRPDGSVSVVGTASMWEPPSFLRPPSQPHAPVRLFYTTQSESVGSGALMMQTAGGAERVAVNLRGGEAPLMVTGYPGGSGAALTLVRTIQPPMVEFVLDEDRGSPTPTWSQFLSMGGSYGLYTPAWLSPTQLLVGTDQAESAATLTLWPACFGYPGRRVGGYTPVRASDGAPDPGLMALDAGHALVVSAAHPHVWSLFTVRTGEVSATAIPYQPGAWTVVRGRSRAHC